MIVLPITNVLNIVMFQLAKKIKNYVINYIQVNICIIVKMVSIFVLRNVLNMIPAITNVVYRLVIKNKFTNAKYPNIVKNNVLWMGVLISVSKKKKKVIMIQVNISVK